MILSVSRRTDIPAFYSQWFFNRLKEGYVLVRNPVNPKIVSRVKLNREDIDGIVFWTKNPAAMTDRLHLLDRLPYYFLFTVTPYGPDLEQHLPPKEEILDTFIHLSQRTGKHRVIWRYDPILLSAALDESYHYSRFEAMARRLAPHTGRCIISFLDLYKKCERNLRGHQVKAISIEEMKRIAERLANIARANGIQIQTCAESHDFTDQGVPPGKCIDDVLLSGISRVTLKGKKDNHQRKTCLCTESIDIGAYDTCGHNCLYCYANAGAATVLRNLPFHQPDSPLLLGSLKGDEHIAERPVKSLKIIQKDLFQRVSHSD